MHCLRCWCCLGRDGLVHRAWDVDDLWDELGESAVGSPWQERVAAPWNPPWNGI